MNSEPSILAITPFFPKPGNELMGSWALSRVRGLAQAGARVRVVAPTAWMPRWVGRLTGYRAWAECPRSHEWDGLHADYPRWLLYQKGALKRQSFRQPLLQNRIAWRSVRGSLLRIVDEFKPDYVWGQFAWTGGYIAKRLHEERGIPYFVSEHDDGEIRGCHSFPARRKMYADVYRNATAVIAIANHMRDELRELFPDVPVHVVNNGVDPFPQELHETPRPREVEDKTVIFSCGTLTERKKMHVLLAAFEEVAQANADVILRVAGDGEDRDKLERQIASMKHGNRVTLLGHISHRQVLQEMAWADVFALVSSPEPFGNVYMEAMSAGTPIICCEDAGVNDIMVDGTHGFAVRADDVQGTTEALRRMAEHPALRASLGDAARELVTHDMSWQAYGGKVLRALPIERGSLSQ